MFNLERKINEVFWVSSRYGVFIVGNRYNIGIEKFEF